MDKIHFQEAVLYCISSFGRLQTSDMIVCKKRGVPTVDTPYLPSVEVETSDTLAAFSLGNDNDNQSDGLIDTDSNLRKSSPPRLLFGFLLPSS